MTNSANSLVASPHHRALVIPAKPTRRRKPPARPWMNVDDFPNEYALHLEGTCLEPLLFDGTALMMDKSAAHAPGDFVGIWFRTHAWKDDAQRHQAWIKKIKVAAPPWVKSFPYDDNPKSEVQAVMVFEQLNPKGHYIVPCRDIWAIHKVTGWAEAIHGQVDPDSVKPIGLPRYSVFSK